MLETIFVGDAVVPEAVPPDGMKVPHLRRLLQDVEDSVESFLGVEVLVYFGDQMVMATKGRIGNSIEIFFRILDSNLEPLKVYQPIRVFEPGETGARDEEERVDRNRFQVAVLLGQVQEDVVEAVVGAVLILFLRP